MSVKVELDQLPAALADFTFAYLITVGDDHRPHIVAIEAAYSDGVFEISESSNSAQRNVTAHPAVTLVWPPSEPDGLTLLVDGDAEPGTPLRITATSAVLHRRR